MEPPEAIASEAIDMATPQATPQATQRATGKATTTAMATPNANETASSSSNADQPVEPRPISYDPSDTDVASNAINRLLTRTQTSGPDAKQKLQRRTASWKSRQKVYTSDDDITEPSKLSTDTSLTDAQRFKKLPRPSRLVPDIELGHADDAGMTESERNMYARLHKATTLRITSFDRNGSLPPIAAMTRSHFGLDEYSTFLVPPPEDRELIIKRVPKNLLSRYYRGKALTRRFSRRCRAQKKSTLNDQNETESAPSDYIADFEYWYPSDVFEAAERARVSLREKAARRAARAKAKSSAEASSRALSESKPLAEANGAERDDGMIWTIKADALQLLHDSQSSDDSEQRPSIKSTPELPGPGGERLDDVVSVDADVASVVDVADVAAVDDVADVRRESGADNQVVRGADEAGVDEDSSDESERERANTVPQRPLSPMSPQPLFEELMKTLEVDPGAIINIPEVKVEVVLPQASLKSEDEVVAKEEPTPVTLKQGDANKAQGQNITRRRKRRKPRAMRLPIADESCLQGFEKEKYLAMMYCQAPVCETLSCGVPVQYVGNRAAARGHKRKPPESAQPVKRLRPL